MTQKMHAWDDRNDLARPWLQRNRSMELGNAYANCYGMTHGWNEWFKYDMSVAYCKLK